MTYPDVLGETATLAQVCAGASIARYGDGELNLCRSRPAKMQAADARLSARLREILTASGDCLVGIPNIRSKTPKHAFWHKYLAASDLLADRPYVSSFITRPDSAPWINADAYWDALQSLWIDREVTLVTGGRHGLSARDLIGSRDVRSLFAPSSDAFSHYDEILEAIGTPKLALLCLGPTATVLAVDLCAKGVQAIDLGHVGLFIRKHRRGEPMIVTDEDKAA